MGTRTQFSEFYCSHFLNVSRLILPIIVADEPRPDAAIRVTPLADLPALCERVAERGLMGIKIFPTSIKHANPDDLRRAMLDPGSLLHRAVKAARQVSNSLYIETELCVCSHTPDENCIVRDAETTIALLCDAGRIQGELGASAVGVANMVPGTTRAVRQALSARIGVVAHLISLSPFYLPWRRATGHTLKVADRKTHLHLDPRRPERLLERGIEMRNEGADCILVEPGLSNIDIAIRLRQAGPGLLCAFLVSGESLMLGRASLEESYSLHDMLFRAGYDSIATYQALDLAEFARA
jgi:porphobilinogen synthase